jgi:Type I phosphodiesterase / nucleotide pyrophosphatase
VTVGPPVPRYGESALSDLMPSMLSALGVPGLSNALEVEPLRGLCVLVMDGLGWEQILSYRDAAPFLARTADESRPLTAGFPATTSASLGSLGTGLPPGEHGLVGYTFAVPGFDRPMNALQWELYGVGEKVDLIERLPPERIQPNPTFLERAEAEGLGMTVIGPPEHEHSPLSRAILRGGRYEGAHSLDDVVAVVSTHVSRPSGPGERRAVYAYHPFLDTTGHLSGVGSEPWLAYLALVDRAVAAIAGRLGPGWALVVTGDHGMVNLTGEERVDVADVPELMAGVRFLAGEARARHVHARAGAEADVLAVWRAVLGDRMWIATRDEAIDAGWFGPRVADGVGERIGDVVAAASGPVGVFQRDVDPLQSQLVGHHGSMTPAEQLVPFLLVRG